ncbi:DUF3306 domain-containing protein [Variovorax terrae]|uniref:DUF3306 domain-containing protein n=1 Tax=Variovorax terrae TaxID=2923278 RepID=A0A9X2APR4_9BURK|nr:DUF3306 domain-containing protein [Variovorax terrae]MCJ0765170.1 DUF3306 domain-containing protein [Variovorax terrae]
MADGFLGRWSRRKQEARSGQAAPEETLAPQAPEAVPVQLSTSGSAPPAAPAAELPAAAPALTLDDVQALTPASDFKAFVARGVAPEVRNAAMKKLFADPHFNVMDRLDVYIDDYSQPDPLPLAALRQMASAKALGLVDDEAPAKDPEGPDAGVDAQTLPAPDVAQSGVCNELPSPLVNPVLPASQDHDAHADLRLQPDDAASAPSDRRSAS